jgi:general stress protein 26
MAQAGKPEDVWNTIQHQRIAMMTTEEDGRLVSRPMASLARPEDGKVYFIAKRDAHVASEAEFPVNLGYADSGDNTYLSVSGTAHVTQDHEKLRELWSMWTEAWLPQGPDADDVALIAVEPEEAKLWDSTSSKLLYAGKVAMAVARQSPPNAGKVKQVKM